jgi:hypothetical protein
VRKLLCIPLGALIFLTAHGSPTLADSAPDDDQGTQQPYFDRFMGGAFFQQHIDVVLARVVGPLATWPDGYDTGYTLEVLDDYGGGLQEHERVRMFGMRPAPNGSSFGPLRILAAYDTASGDVESLKRIVNTQEDLTLPQAVWVYYLLTWVVPEDKRPSKADSDALLVGYVGRVAKPLGE